MKEGNLELAQKDIDEALETIQNMEENLSKENLPKEVILENFKVLTEKVSKLELILKEEGILE
ncbi:hypothetical protein Ccar_21245 [Clostridium carboxidivorans P7]|uniref:Uncharacterized protein n=1 Tax=Clostridium carboxidivorans P7 TaxID=536227 RepID=C6Q0S3_9CLOT|nr:MULTISPECIES: hypothetical protein [Clostridium]AKN33215.1 hypothetical protein Ccar_21245 [Clostridium carboxidivorans P7]EET84891.1 conserved hypothetical protein [Clostridium carboxidivorans P7]WPC41999.1 hypothetical protein Q6H37_00515 [Clostridium sp. JS66]